MNSVLFNSAKRTVELYRITNNSNTQDYSKITDIEIYIQSMDAELSATDASFSRTQKAWATSGTDIRIDDKIVDGSDTYIVTGVNNYAEGFFGKWKVAYLEKVKS